jgi:hypothetical protein
MPRYLIRPAAAANGVLVALDAQNRAARARGEPGQNVSSPVTWDGQGSPPIGWTLPCGALPEVGGSRVAIVASDAFADGKAQFNTALTSLPADWASGVA